ncbi:unnamed protein product [Lampetra fluviatilis]
MHRLQRGGKPGDRTRHTLLQAGSAWECCAPPPSIMQRISRQWLRVRCGARVGFVTTDKGECPLREAAALLQHQLSVTPRARPSLTLVKTVMRLTMAAWKRTLSLLSFSSLMGRLGPLGPGPVPSVRSYLNWRFAGSAAASEPLSEPAPV